MLSKYESDPTCSKNLGQFRNNTPHNNEFRLNFMKLTKNNLDTASLIIRIFLVIDFENIRFTPLELNTWVTKDLEITLYYSAL